MSAPYKRGSLVRTQLRPPIQTCRADLLTEQRKSLPSLLMVSRDLTKVLNERYPAEAETQDYMDRLAALTAVPAPSS
jgi:hypothetical protein